MTYYQDEAHADLAVALREALEGLLAGRIVIEAEPRYYSPPGLGSRGWEVRLRPRVQDTSVQDTNVPTETVRDGSGQPVRDVYPGHRYGNAEADSCFGKPVADFQDGL